MRVRPPLLVTMLIYLALDFSLPSMPGAFVFEPGNSVESVQMGRSRVAAEGVLPLAPAGDPAVVKQPRVSVKQLSSLPREAARVPLHVADGLPRGTTLDPAPLSEDPY